MHVTRISSFPNLDLIKSAREATLVASATSTWWNSTRWDRPESLSVCSAWIPLSSFLAVSTTLIPAEANCLTISNPIPLFAPVTTAYLTNSTPTPQRWKGSTNVKFKFNSRIGIWVSKTKHKKDKRRSYNANVLHLSVVSPIFSVNFQVSYCKPFVVAILLILNMNKTNVVVLYACKRMPNQSCLPRNSSYLILNMKKTNAEFSCIWIHLT